MLSTDATKKGSIQSVERALSLLELLSSTNESLSASEIAEELNMKRTTVYGLLTTLIQKDYVAAENSGYQISGKLYNLSYKFPIRFPVTQIAYKYMLELSQAYDLTAHLGILDIKDRVLMVKAAFPRTDAAHTGIVFPYMPPALERSCWLTSSRKKGRSSCGEWYCFRIQTIPFGISIH